MDNLETFYDELKGFSFGLQEVYRSDRAATPLERVAYHAITKKIEECLAILHDIRKEHAYRRSIVGKAKLEGMPMSAVRTEEPASATDDGGV